MAVKELIRFMTCGNVDDGKSTLIGRLLLDSGNIFSDQINYIREESVKHGKLFDLSLLTDGLIMEREEGKTIDVAYRFFETEKRKFILADAPGHIEYTPNMITAASTVS